MKRKGVQLKVISFFITFILCCSFPLSVFAADYNYNDIWGYNDSYVDNNDLEDKSLMFFPLAPDSEFQNYMIYQPANSEFYYLFLNNGWGSTYYIYNGNRIISTSPWDIYLFKPGFSNSWEFYSHSDGTNDAWWTQLYYPGGLRIIDATLPVEAYGIGDPVYNPNNRLKTGYRIYWQLAIMFKFICAKLLTYSDYVLEHELIRYAMLTGFAGEVIYFVIKILQRLGDLKNAEE